MEVYHLIRLADGGVDNPINTVRVCLNHHRELHHGKYTSASTTELQSKRTKEKSAVDV